MAAVGADYQEEYAQDGEEQLEYDDADNQLGDGTRGEAVADGEAVQRTQEELAKLQQEIASLQQQTDEQKKLQSHQERAASEAGLAPAGTAAAAEAPGDREEADSRSIYVGNVDYGVSPEELQQLFAACGTVQRVTILTDKFGNPKGYAYVEFLEPEAVKQAELMTETELNGRKIQVKPKRTNLPGLRARGRGRGRRGGGGGFGGSGYGPPGGFWGVPPPFGWYPPPMPYGGGGRGRGRGRGRGFYAPY